MSPYGFGKCPSACAWFSFRQLNHSARTHHGNPVTNIANKSEVVRNEEVAHASLHLQFGEQFDNLLLRDQVESTHRFITNNELRFQHERTRNRDALLLPRYFVCSWISSRMKAKQSAGSGMIAAPCRST